jgi:hypothetical protein
MVDQHTSWVEVQLILNGVGNRIRDLFGGLGNLAAILVVVAVGERLGMGLPMRGSWH